MDVRDDDAVGPREDGSEVPEHRRCPMEGQRLVDRPEAASGIPIGHGRERGGHRRRVVPVVVEDGDAIDLALQLHPPAHTGEGRQTLDDRGEPGAGDHGRCGRDQAVLRVVASREPDPRGDGS